MGLPCEEEAGAGAGGGEGEAVEGLTAARGVLGEAARGRLEAIPPGRQHRGAGRHLAQRPVPRPLQRVRVGFEGGEAVREGAVHEILVLLRRLRGPPLGGEGGGGPEVGEGLGALEGDEGGGALGGAALDPGPGGGVRREESGAQGEEQQRRSGAEGAAHGGILPRRDGALPMGTPRKPAALSSPRVSVLFAMTPPPPADTSAFDRAAADRAPPDLPPVPSGSHGSRHVAETPSPTRLLEGLRRRRPLRIRLLIEDARALAALARGDHHQELGFASVGELAECLGFSAPEGRTLHALGRALDGWPGLEERLLAGRLNPDKAAAFTRLLEVGGALRAGEGPPRFEEAARPSPEPLPGEAVSWLAAAEEEPTLDFQRRVARRCEEALRGVPVERMTFLVSQSGMVDFRRCRGLVSGRANRRFSQGETLEILASNYLDHEDPLRVRGRARRAPDTSGTAGRHVPEEVRRAVLARAGGRCEFPRCGFDTWLDLAHVVAHRHGGSREADNLLLLCGVHHRALDGGTITAVLEEGRLLFRNPWGQELEGPAIGGYGTRPDSSGLGDGLPPGRWSQPQPR